MCLPSRYTGTTPSPPPGSHYTSPSENMWNTGGAYNMSTGMAVAGTVPSSLSLLGKADGSSMFLSHFGSGQSGHQPGVLDATGLELCLQFEGSLNGFGCKAFSYSNVRACGKQSGFVCSHISSNPGGSKSFLQRSIGTS